MQIIPYKIVIKRFNLSNGEMQKNMLISKPTWKAKNIKLV